MHVLVLGDSPQIFMAAWAKNENFVLGKIFDNALNGGLLFHNGKEYGKSKK